MLWLKALHVVFVVTWFAGLFYLPRLFVYHAAASDALGIERFILMERRLFVIMSIGALLAAIFGLAMILASPGYLREPWLQLKLLLVALLVGYHLWCYRIVAALALRRNLHSQHWFRWFNEVPSLLLLVIVILAVVKPALR
jgi:putative membrane protein